MNEYDQEAPRRYHEFELAACGWSPKMIRDLLDPHDVMIPHPRIAGGRPIGAYDAERVDAIRASDAYADALKHHLERSATYARNKIQRPSEGFLGIANPELRLIEENRELPPRVTIRRDPIATIRGEIRWQTDKSLVHRILQSRVFLSPQVKHASFGDLRRKKFVLRAVASMYPELLQECARRITEVEKAEAMRGPNVAGSRVEGKEEFNPISF